MLRQTLKMRENSGDAAPTPSKNSQSKWSKPMTSKQNEQMYSINDIREAFEATHNGTTTDYNQPIITLATQMLESSHVYVIGPGDLESYLDNDEEANGDLTEEQKEKFRNSARKYIENTETFGEILNICLQLAMDEARKKN